MKLEKALNEKVMDVRLIDRLLAQGKITKKQVDEYISQIEDSEGSYERIGSNTNTAPVEESLSSEE